MEPFQMFKNGSMWKPPLGNVFTGGMPAEILDKDGGSLDIVEESVVGEKKKETYKAPPPTAPPGKRPLSDKQRDHLEETLRNLVPDRQGNWNVKSQISSPQECDR